jgi:uncharacterized DUF497 family protein
MMGTTFQWDEAKNLSNEQKHGIRFEQAALVFLDPLVISIKERVQNEEERWQTLGCVEGLLLVLVAHTVHNASPSEEVIRIISARRATPKERRRYEEGNR